MLSCVTEHGADCPDLDACGESYFARLHSCFGKHPPEASFRLSERLGSLVYGFREFALFYGMVVVRRRMRLFMADGERCMGPPLFPPPHVDALVLGNPDGQPLCLPGRGQRAPSLPETYHRLLRHILGFFLRREETHADGYCLAAQDVCQTCELSVLHTP